MTSTNINPRTGDILKLWNHLFEGLEGYLCVSSAVWDVDEDGNPTKDLTGFRDEFYQYPEQAKTAAEDALFKSAEGREVWFCPHLLTEKKRQKPYATHKQALHTEYDRDDYPNSYLSPTALVESSPGHWHTYHRMTNALDPLVAEDLNKRLSKKTDGDKWYLTSLLRVPNTTNYKYPDHPTVTLRDIRPFKHKPDYLDEQLPKEA